jgi:hypothetical protein
MPDGVDATRMEYLDAGPARSGVTASPPPSAKHTRRWVPYVAGAVTFLVVLFALGVLVADWAARNYEMRSLVTQIESSEAAMTELQDNVRAIFTKYEGSAPLSDDDRAALDAELTAAAKESGAAIAAAGDRVQAVRWLSWHRDVGDAQAAYLTHNRAWQAYMARAATDPAEFGVDQEEVNTTFAAAEHPIRDALPVPALFGLRSRIDVIFAPPPAPDGQTQQA